jgi:hypothetical protein
LKIRQTLAEQDKSNSSWQSDLAVGYEGISDVLVAQGKLQEALDTYQQKAEARNLNLVFLTALNSLKGQFPQ